MVQKFGRISAAVVLTSVLLLGALSAACQASIFSPINAVTNAVTKTTKKVAKTSVNTVKTVVSAPKKIATKVGSTISGKKTK